MKIEVRTV